MKAFPKTFWLSKKFGRLKLLDIDLPNYIRKFSNFKFWFQCDCGKRKQIVFSSISLHNTNSCGCLGRETHLLPKGEAGFRQLLRTYKQSAKNKGIKFLLTEKEVRLLVSSPCYYCGRIPTHYTFADVRRINPETTENGKYLSNGIDRINNKLGYVLKNCVPCCKFCNVAKNNYTLEEFYRWAIDLYKNRKNWYVH